MLTHWLRLPTVLRATLAGVAVAAAGTLPWAGLSLANQKYLVAVPWAVVVMAIYLWFLWRWLRGEAWPSTTTTARRDSLRANSVDPDAFGLAIFAALIGFAALMPFAMLLGRLVTLNAASPIKLPDGMPVITGFLLIAMASVVAGVVEESAFRGYMQGPSNGGTVPRPPSRSQARSSVWRISRTIQGSPRLRCFPTTCWSLPSMA